jgi:uncharacterized repeat protein (TIGR02543 family)
LELLKVLLKIFLIGCLVFSSILDVGAASFKNNGPFNAETNQISAITNGTSANLVARVGSTTVIDIANMLIYGLFTDITEAEFIGNYIQVNGNNNLSIQNPSGIFATGSKVILHDKTTNLLVETYETVIFGDVNGDGSVDSMDAGTVVDFENYLIQWDPITAKAFYKAADINGDGSIDSLDAGIMVDSENYIITLDQATGMVSAKEYVVRFVDYNGAVLLTQTVKEGKNASLPTNPVRQGYVFAGWNGDYSSVTSSRDIAPVYIDSSASNIFSVSSKSGNTGDTVKLLVTLGGTVKTCGFDLRMKYDNSVLEFVSVNADLGLDVVANHIASSNEIAFNFSTTANKTVTKSVVEATFRIRDTVAKDTVVKLSAVEVIFVDPNNHNLPMPIAYNLVDGVVFVNR